VPDWVVDVVLRALGEDDVEARVVAEVAGRLPPPDGRPPPRSTGSFEMPPPDGSIGVSCWTSANAAGEAVDGVLATVTAAAASVTGKQHPLWDIRVLPANAVLTREEVGPGS
jgi:hypothetical protein